MQEGKAGMYIIGGIIVKDKLDIRELKGGWDEAIKMSPVLRYSPHYYRDNDYTIAIIGKGFILEPLLPVSLRVPGKLVGPPNDLLKKLLGEDRASKYARKRYRKSSGATQKSVEEVIEILEKHDAKLYYSN